MNYKKIYDDLIEHRKMMPKLEGVYYERHHINPVCMGGSDDEENLIDLTAEDHFVAHVLLAKIYGGKLWFAAQMMSAGVKGSKRCNRKIFAILRNGAACARKGMKYASQRIKNAPVYVFRRNYDDFLIKCNRFELEANFGLSLKCSKRLERGVKISGGFSIYADVIDGKVILREELLLPRTERKQRKQDMKSKPEKEDKISPLDVPMWWVRITDGIRMFKTRREMSVEFGLDITASARLLRGRHKQLNGFCLERIYLRDGPFKQRAGRKLKYRFQNVNTREIIICTVQELSQKTGGHVKTIQRLAVGAIGVSFGHVCLGKEETPEEVS